MITNFINPLRFYLVLILWLMYASGLSQSPDEQVKTLLDKLEHNLSVEEKMKSYLDLAAQYQQLPNQTDSVKHYANSALKIAKENGNKEVEHAAFYRLGMASWYGDENFIKAKEYFQESKSILEILNNKHKIPQVDNAIGSINLIQGNYEEALSFYQTAFIGAKEIEDFEIMAMAGTNMSIIYVNTGDTINSIKINEEALSSLEGIKDKELDQTRVAILINLGDLYKKTNQFEKAQNLVNKTRAIVSQLGSFRQEGRLSILEARLLDAMGKTEELYAFVNKKIPDLPKGSGYDREIYTSMLVYQGKGLVEQNDFSGAKAISNELSSFLGKSNKKHERNLLKSLYELNKEIGDFRLAFAYLNQYAKLKDVMLNDELQDKLIEAENKFQLEKKEREIEQEKIKNLELNSRNAKLLLGILGLIILGLGVYLWQFRKRQEQKQKIDEIEQKILALQMNPHFIFNAISSIQNYLFDEGDKKKAIQHLSTFATLMRQMLENSRERFISLDEELDFLTNYLDLQQLRFDNKFEYEITVDENVNRFDVSIPPLLTQPFVENAIEHGKLYAVENGKLQLKISKINGRLQLKILDNGIGMEQSKMNEKSGLIKKNSLSIKITDERLKLLSRLMNKKWTLEILNNAGSNGTEIHIDIPLISIN